MKKKSNKSYEELIESIQKGWYIEKINKVLEKKYRSFSSIVKDVQYLNEECKQDGSYVYNKFVEELKTKKYPKEIEEKIIEEFKNAFLVEFYEKTKEKRENKQESEYSKAVKQITKYVNKHIFEWAYSDFENSELQAIGKEIASAPIEIQKLLIDLGYYRYFTKSPEEINIYALEKGATVLDAIENRNENIDLIAAKLGAITNIKKIKDLSKEAKLIFIENNPDKIITKITAENFNTKDLTIYDLNKKELEAYNRGIEARNKKEEEKQIELVKKDPREIYKIKNPSSLVKNYAVNEFRKRWER